MRFDAPLGPRVLAHIVDLIPISLIYLAVYFELGEATSLLAISLLGSVLVLSIVLYFSLFEVLFSTTPGKKLMNLYVISVDPLGPLSPRQALVRNMLRLTDIFLFYLPTFVLRRRIGDILAGTAVVSEDLMTLKVRGFEESVAEALLPIIERKLERTDYTTRAKLMELGERAEIPHFIESMDAPEEVKRVLAAILKWPEKFRRAFTPSELIQVYRVASQLAYRPEEREELLQLSRVIEALHLTRRRDIRLGYAFHSLRRVPNEFRSLIPYFVLSVVLLIVISYTAAILRPDPLIKALKELFSTTDGEALSNTAYVFSVIFLNNVRVAILLLGLSPTVIVPLLMLLVNGLVIGGLLGAYAAEGKALQALILILPHGVPELTAIFIVTSLSLKAAKIVVIPPKEGRILALRKLFLGSLEVLIAATLLLFYAAVIEAAVTRSLSSDPVKGIVFSLIEGVVIYTLLLKTSSSS